MEAQNRHPHKNLLAWQTAMLLCEMIYKVTTDFPTEEKFGLTSQLRRASVSVPSNIAEGAARKSKAEFSHFISISLGSLSEIDTQLEISKRLGFLKSESFMELDELVSKTKALAFGLNKHVSAQTK